MDSSPTDLLLSSQQLERCRVSKPGSCHYCHLVNIPTVCLTTHCLDSSTFQAQIKQTQCLLPVHCPHWPVQIISSDQSGTIFYACDPRIICTIVGATQMISGCRLDICQITHNPSFRLNHIMLPNIGTTYSKLLNMLKHSCSICHWKLHTSNYFSLNL